MKVVVSTLTEKEFIDRDFNEVVQIEIDGEIVFKVMDGEVDESHIYGTFADCRNVRQLLETAYLSGSKREGFELTRNQRSDI